MPAIHDNRKLQIVLRLLIIVIVDLENKEQSNSIGLIKKF